MEAIRKRALLAWLLCLCGALAACLWIRTGAPVDSFARLESAAADGAVVTVDRGHAHDPARVPQSAPIEASESEEQCAEDGEARDDSRLAVAGPHGGLLIVARHEDRTAPRNPCTSQHNNRGPPLA